jgi:hypothetical protein
MIPVADLNGQIISTLCEHFGQSDELSILFRPFGIGPQLVRIEKY